MFAVVATKIRGSRDCGPPHNYEGYLLAAPAIGRGMVIFRDPHGRRMVTTAVRRVLTMGAENTLYVETENSVYRLAIREEALAAVG